MKFRTKIPSSLTRAGNRRRAGFTLVEVLVALIFMAVVLPVIVQAMKVASLAGEVAQRKAFASRIAEKVLNETIVTGQWNKAGQTGTETSGPYQFHWTIRSDPWDQLANVIAVSTPAGLNQTYVNQNILHVLSVDVSFLAQGRNYTVTLSTLANISQQLNINPPPAQ